MANVYLELFPPEGEKKLEEVLPLEAAIPPKEEEQQPKFSGHVPLSKRLPESVRRGCGCKHAPRHK